jgi:hypothetical protein
MGNQIHTNRVAERFCSHTLSHSRPSGCKASADIDALRRKLITATVQVVAEGGDPRLVKTLALS